MPLGDSWLALQMSVTLHSLSVTIQRENVTVNIEFPRRYIKTSSDQLQDDREGFLTVLANRNKGIDEFIKKTKVATGFILCQGRLKDLIVSNVT